jgi:Cu/Zn superoxide dismutase
VVHEKKDDLQSDPAGNSGARVACGTLQAASN